MTDHSPPARGAGAPTGAPTVALVPVRAPSNGKTRLAGALTEPDRAALVGAMLTDVAAALSASTVAATVVAAGGPEAATVASALGLDVILDPPGGVGLDAALAAAAASLDRSSRLLVVAADLPTLTSEEVDLLLAEDAVVVVAPTLDGGTGGLLRTPADAIPTAYGAGSAARHLELARQRGHVAKRLALPGFARDVDTVADLRPLLRPEFSAQVGPATARVLGRLAARLDAAG